MMEYFISNFVLNSTAVFVLPALIPW